MIAGVASLALLCGCAADSVGASTEALGGGSADHPYRLQWDDFRDGFSAGAADSRWFYFAAGPFAGTDGIETTSPHGLRVVASGVNPVSGEPAFTLSVGQEQDNGGLPGGLDHVKWLVYMNHLASSGYPGFDAVPGRELACEAWIGGRSYGTAGHPFGSAVDNPNDDLRLAAPAMNTIDFESFMVFDFFFTNETVYAFYERLPFAWGHLGHYAAFSYQIPVASRTPGQIHHAAIAYDRSAGVVRWLLDGEEVFRVDQIGHRIDREFMTIDHGGTETTVVMNQMNCGMGMFTLLDAALPSGQPLVRLSSAENFYYDASVGAPTPATFVDEQSLESNRLWGQGAEINVRRYVVTSRPSSD